VISNIWDDCLKKGLLDSSHAKKVVWIFAKHGDLVNLGEYHAKSRHLDLIDFNYYQIIVFWLTRSGLVSEDIVNEWVNEWIAEVGMFDPRKDERIREQYRETIVDVLDGVLKRRGLRRFKLFDEKYDDWVFDD
jgi:hypothetical protein